MVAPVISPARDSVKVAAKLECSGADGFLGVTHCRKGRTASRAVYTDEGTASGRLEMKGARRDGVES